MMINIVKVFWLRLHALLRMFADRLAVADRMLIRDLGYTTNEAFLLRGYLALRRHADGDEIAISIDVQNNSQQLILESDICTSDGEVIATGPSAVIPLVAGQLNIEAAIHNWLNEFEQFLLENEQVVASATSKLI